MTRLRATTVALLLVATAAGAAGCGEPKAQLLETSDRLRLELPVEFTDLPMQAEDAPRAFGLPDSAADELNSDPVLYVLTAEVGGEASFQSLREVVTGGQYDPLSTDDEAAASTGDTTVLDYEEISHPDVWGVRMRLAIGRSATDYQALVDRRSGEVVITQLVCTQACFLEQIDLIDQIQGSWTLES